MEWYGKDFGQNRREILLYISRYLPSEISQSIQPDPEQWDLDYDWSLNE